MIRRLLALLPVLGCGAEGPAPTDTPTACTYPDAPRVMEEGEPLPAFSWPAAIHGDGRSGPLDLAGVPCDSGDIDWSPFDVLLFVSIPAW